MPGIVGILTRRPLDSCEALVCAMIDQLQHRPHQPCSKEFVPNMGVYAGWVGHNNRSDGAKKICNEQKDVALLFSGECFAEPDTRTRLGQKGHRLSGTGGDWLVDLYEEEGDQFFEKLNGLFSGLLVDQRRNKAFLFNDRYGVERIYVHETRDATYFASEAKALLAVLPDLRAFDQNGVAQYLAYGCTLGERTLFRGISLLPGGSKWTFEYGAIRSKERYFEPVFWETQETVAAEQFEDEFSETFRRVLPRYSEHGESVGISLTGGLDTRMVMACLPQTETSHPCYTFVGESGLTLDARLSARIAEVRGLRHHVLGIEPDFLRNFGTHLDRTVRVTDGYAGATASHEIYFNARARELSPIRLTGNFGSEILRSVSTFKPIRLNSELLSKDCAALVGSETQRMVGKNVHAVTFAAFREIPWKLFGLLAAGRSQLTFRTLYLDNELVALAYRAPASLRHSPLPALELVRSASPELARIPTDRGELLGGSVWGHAFRRAFGEVTFKLDYYHTEGLPPFLNALDPCVNALSPFGVLGLHKFLPYRRWFRNELVPVVLERISSDRVRCAPWWAKNAPEAVARKHVAGQGNYVRELNAILTLEAIERLLVAGEPLGVSVEQEKDLEAAI